MVRTSKLFHVLIGGLLLVIIGLTAAIFLQRQEGDKALLKARLLLDGKRMEVIAERARMVSQQLPTLKEQNEGVKERWKQVQGRTYQPTDRAELESVLSQIATGAQLKIVRFEDQAVREGPLFREHEFLVRLSGPMTNLPAWAEAFYKQRRLGLIDRISVVSPDYLFQKVRITVLVHYFEARDPATILAAPIPIEKFDVPLTYLGNQETPADPVYGETLVRVREKVSTLSTLRGELKIAGQLEKQIAGTQQLVEAWKAVEEKARANRRTTLEHLPALYLQVRNSPLGSVAMLVQEGNVRFVEVAGDE